MSKQPAKPGSTTDLSVAEVVDGLVQRLCKEHAVECGYHNAKLSDLQAGKEALDQPKDRQLAILGVAVDRIAVLDEKLADVEAKLLRRQTYYQDTPEWRKLATPRRALNLLIGGLLRRGLPLKEDDLLRILAWPVAAADKHVYPSRIPLTPIVGLIESFAKSNPISPDIARGSEQIAAELRRYVHDRPLQKLADRFEAICAGGRRLRLEAGEAWSDAALTDLEQGGDPSVAAWNALLLHCQEGGRGKWTERWSRQCAPLLAQLGWEQFKGRVLRWLPLVDRPRTQADPSNVRLPHSIIDPHVELLRGLVWCCATREDADLARSVMRLALSAYRKVPGKGPRLVSLGNACITCLGMMPGQTALAQLALLQVKVRFGTAQREIAKALSAVAVREGVPRDLIEELAVPAYGLEGVGQLLEPLGGYEAQLRIDRSVAALTWSKDGKPLKSVPAAAKKEHAEEVKQLQAAVKDINTMLPAQRERIDSLFLSRRTWGYSVWRERYLDHPLLGTIARRLIWAFTCGSETLAGIWLDDEVRGVDGRPLALTEQHSVALWHPIDQPVADVLAWRQLLMAREIVQPFKQAHREVYPLTAAEQRTRTYSNRFAAHILRQHQFNALCLARGWKNKLRLMVDDAYPPAYRLLPAWNLRAEFWIEGLGEETNHAGVYLYVTTDQVRFYPLEAPQVTAHAGGGGYGPGWNQAAADPLPLESIPPLVLSEVLRDADLFVGVASVGNDPTWSDNRPNDRQQGYWRDYSFGELAATAVTRRDLLQQLIPRLKIADRCAFDDRFLVVRGELRTYKIHLGSGNILMSPNDQYLCIVPQQSVSAPQKLFLPFEGDSVLSIILSKAFLLADDVKILDPSITRQLQGR
ncbi:MAG: DUF4132 domain-containing protein [Pirellulales bacterium]